MHLRFVFKIASIIYCIIITYNNNGLINVSNFIEIENNNYEIILILTLMVRIPFQMAAWSPRSINHQIPILHYG